MLRNALAIVFLLLSIKGVKAQGKRIDSENHLFQLGKNAFARKNYQKALVYFDLAYWKFGPLSQRSLFYIIFSQYRLDKKLAAKGNFKHLKMQYLRPAEKKVAEKIWKKVKKSKVKVIKDPIIMDINPYIGQVGHDKNTLKGSASFKGINIGVGRKRLRLDSAYEKYNLDYNSSTIASYEQDQLSGLLTWFYSTNRSIKLGATTFSTNYDLNNSSKTYFLGWNFYWPLKGHGGIEAAYSIYPGFLPSEAKVIQFSPYYTWYFGNYFKYGSVFLSLRYFWISPKVSNNTGTEQADQVNAEFHSGEVELSYWKGQFNFLIALGLGKQNFAVTNSGFVVFNNSELHKGYQKIVINYNRSKTWGAGVSVTSRSFFDNDLNQDASSNSIMLSVLWKNY
jgi:hypothetical protein